jgi:hypothetical protein
MREMGEVTLAEANQLVHLYADRGSPKFEKAALRWLARYLDEGEPSLERFVATVESLARRAR